MNTDKLLEDVSGRYARLYFAAIHELYVAKVRDDRVSARAARQQLAKVMAETMGVGEILGASLCCRTSSAAPSSPQTSRRRPCCLA